MSLLVVDVETDSLRGPGAGGRGLVVEIGIAEIDGRDVRPVWGTVVRQPEADPGAWIFTHSGASLTWDEVQHGMPESEASEIYRGITSGRKCVSWNMGFDFDGFLLHPPWSAPGIAGPELLADPMLEAADRCICGQLGCDRGDKWPRADEAYLFYCRGFDPETGTYDAAEEGPAGYHGEHHRALDDAVYEAHIIRAMIDRGHYPEVTQ